MYKHILAATDGSELANKGLEHAVMLAHAVGAKVTVLNVRQPLSATALQAAVSAGVINPATLYDQSIDEEMKARFAVVEQLAREKSVSVELAHEVDDHPAEAIVRFAKIYGCDLIVMSSHGRRGVRRLVLGSQTAEVVTHTDIPVLVVR
jgi:nucleotide-binding universal stress UspA family protein